MADGLVAFLRERLREDEERARSAVTRAGGRWVADGTDLYEVHGDLTNAQRCAEHPAGVPNPCDDELVGWASDVLDDAEDVAAFWGAFDPARVLAEVDAKRRILDELEQCLRQPDSAYDVASVLLPLLAVPYAPHPDYDERWKP